MEIQKILEHFDTVKPKSGGGFQTKCPVHNGKGNVSLSIDEKDGKILLHCFGGCTAEQVANAVGLKMADLFTDNGTGPKQSPKPKPETTSRNKRPFLHYQLGMPVKKYPYKDEAGRLLYYVCRFEGETVKAITGRKKPCGHAQRTAGITA